MATSLVAWLRFAHARSHSKFSAMLAGYVGLIELPEHACACRAASFNLQTPPQHKHDIQCCASIIAGSVITAIGLGLNDAQHNPSTLTKGP